MKAVILCGGLGTRLREETEFRPKPMIEIGGMPILWHIMKTYSSYGFNEFILCLGYKGKTIKDFFYNYEIAINDFTIELGTKNIEMYPRHEEHGWKVTLIDTGENTMTGGRVKKVERFIDGDTFMLTYGDGLTDLNIKTLLEFHKSHKKIGTVTGVSPPSRYGELVIHDDHVISFSEKPAGEEAFINGGYFVFNRKFYDYLEDDDSCILERVPLEKLVSDGQLKVFQHRGFWQCMDTYRDYKFLKELWDNKPPWRIWEEKNNK
ncbi:glucose-1-phosphate cytidylyltransferase [Candidatus Magnetobacterium bavaricum]|uniref:Glucose-1-phosphate cytidylyltransferase n=1 Tax=Candidatus Magnetobacterium bavaricum TaxID=29290 RepID=A0A0F3GJI3_9BACT|nr:glucose-1-phosphate cytidylyltransferase [Candidatus Magnetobacterium bavaricum]